MKKQNVRLDNYNSNSQTEVKSSYQTYSKNTIDESNSDNKKNSNFKKSFFICGSPAREKPLESKLNMYGDGADITSGAANDLNQVNKQLKKNLLSNSFYLGNGCEILIKECLVLISPKKWENKMRYFKMIYSQKMKSKTLNTQKMAMSKTLNILLNWIM